MNNPSRPEVWTIRELLNWATEDFKKRGLDSVRLTAELLLANANRCTRVDLYLHFEEAPAPEVLDRFREAVRRRRDREPVAQILGKKAFHDLELAVPPGGFVPRPETELLVDEAVSRLKSLAPPTSILDLGTGAGAIALAILHALPGLTAVAVDLDPLALETAAANARALGLAERITFLQGDLFAPLSGLGPFDLIACNPPYIPSGQIAELLPEVRDHEPRAALDGGEDGLDVIRRLLPAAPDFLRPGGWLLLEVGEGQAAAVVALAPPLFCEAVRPDLRGCPRVVILRKP